MLLSLKMEKDGIVRENISKIREGSLTYLHARILGQLQNPGLLESKLSNTVCHELQEQIKMPVMLTYPAQSTVASSFCRCQNKMQMQLTLQFHQARYK